MTWSVHHICIICVCINTDTYVKQSVIPLTRPALQTAKLGSCEWVCVCVSVRGRERAHAQERWREKARDMCVVAHLYIYRIICIHIYTYVYIYTYIGQERGIYIFVVSFKFHAVDKALWYVRTDTYMSWNAVWRIHIHVLTCCVTWLIHMCDMAHWHAVWRGLVICATWLIDMCNCQWLIDMRTVTHEAWLIDVRTWLIQVTR